MAAQDQIVFHNGVFLGSDYVTKVTWGHGRLRMCQNQGAGWLGSEEPTRRSGKEEKAELQPTRLPEPSVL